MGISAVSRVVDGEMVRPEGLAEKKFTGWPAAHSRRISLPRQNGLSAARVMP